MIIQIDSRCVGIETDIPEARTILQAVFDTMTLEGGTAETDCMLRIERGEGLPALDGLRPFYSSQVDLTPDQDAQPSFYAKVVEGVAHLVKPQGAYAQLPLGNRARPVAQIWLNAAFKFIHFEDFLLLCLAAMLRPMGIFIVHAFAVQKGRRAILLVGRSGSGKTTTGLNLINAGWRYLANDIALIKQTDAGICALPSPGGFSIRPKTLRMLPYLASLAQQMDRNIFNGKYHFSQKDVISKQERGSGAIIEAICFPQVSSQPENALTPMPATIGLANLMEQSVDRWDEMTFDGHLDCLNHLARQAPSYQLQLGSDVACLPDLIESIFSPDAEPL